MLKVVQFVNPLDGAVLQRITSDQGFTVREKSTMVEYGEAVIPLSRSSDEFEETSNKVPEDNA